MELLEPHTGHKTSRTILIAGGCGCIGPSIAHVICNLPNDMEIINIGAIERIERPEEYSIESIIKNYEMVKRPELILTIEDMCIDADDFNPSFDEIKKDNSKFYDHYYKGKRR